MSFILKKVASAPELTASTPPSSSSSGEGEGAEWCGSSSEAPREKMVAPRAKNFLIKLALLQGTKDRGKSRVCVWFSREKLILPFRNARTWSCLYNE